MSVEIKYHVNPETGESNPCDATVRDCKFGVSNHYDTQQDAEAAGQKILQDKHGLVNALKKPRNAMAAAYIPQKHWDTSRADAFYNSTGKVDPEAIKDLALYHYYRIMELKYKDYPEYERPVTSFMKLWTKKKLLESDYGKNWNGWKSDNNKIKEINKDTAEEFYQKNLEKYGPSSEKFDRQKNFYDDNEVRDTGKSLSQYTAYMNDSVEFVSSLTPEEHNAISYWTACGSHIAGCYANGAKNLWDFKSELDEYDDPERYMNIPSYIETVDKALDKFELAESPQVLYRGVDTECFPEDLQGAIYDNREKVVEYVKENYVPGENITFNYAQSSSSSSRVGLNFADNGVIFEVSARKAAPVGVVSAYGYSEMEYILPRTTQYRVVKVLDNVSYIDSRGDKEDGMIVVQLEQIID